MLNEFSVVDLDLFGRNFFFGFEFMFNFESFVNVLLDFLGGIIIRLLYFLVNNLFDNIILFDLFGNNELFLNGNFIDDMILGMNF